MRNKTQVRALVEPSLNQITRFRRDSGISKHMKGRIDYEMEDCVAGREHFNYIQMWLEDRIAAIVHGLPEGMDNESVEMLIDSLTHTLKDKILGAYDNGQRQMFKQIQASGNRSLEQTWKQTSARPKCSGTRDKSGRRIEVGGRMYDMTEFHLDELKAMGVID